MPAAKFRLSLLAPPCLWLPNRTESADRAEHFLDDAQAGQDQQGNPYRREHQSPAHGNQARETEKNDAAFHGAIYGEEVRFAVRRRRLLFNPERSLGLHAAAALDPESPARGLHIA